MKITLDSYTLPSFQRGEDMQQAAAVRTDEQSAVPAGNVVGRG